MFAIHTQNFFSQNIFFGLKKIPINVDKCFRLNQFKKNYSLYI